MNGAGVLGGGSGTSEVFDFEVFGAGLLSQQGGVEHDFGLSFDALVELAHGHVTQALHVLAHLVVRLQLQTPLEKHRHVSTKARSLARRPVETRTLKLPMASCREP